MTRPSHALVAMLKSIRMLLSIMEHLNNEIQKMNVKIKFLNYDIDESIYI